MSYFSDSEDEEDCYIDWAYEIFYNKYIMIKQLGKGSYCSVWLAYNFSKNCFNAIKVYNRCDYKRGKKEIKIFENIKSKKIDNIVTYNLSFNYRNEDYDNGNDSEGSVYSGDSDSDGNVFLCLEMKLGGYSVYDIIKLFRDTDYKPPSDYFYNVAKNTIKIINDIHEKGYIHSDIKPENILLNKPSYETYNIMKKIIECRDCKGSKFAKVTTRNVQEFIKKIKNEIRNIPESKLEDIYNYIFDGNYEVSLCDMGTTVTANSPSLYKKYTIYYRAPETIMKLNYDHTYDYWSFGCSLYEMIFGKILFDAENDLELLYEIITCLGPLPNEMINKSEYKTKFFTSSKRLRGYKKISSKPMFDLSITPDEKINKLLILIQNVLVYKKEGRSLFLN
jgi:serine/threonine protein kinase